MALRSFLNGALFAEVYGEQPPDVLALHGWGRRGRDFAAALDGLSGIAPDLPGFGASPIPDRVLGADDYADIVAGILDQFDGPPVLVGHSFGGRVAVCLAARHPDRVGKIVLTGAPLIRLDPARKPPAAYRLFRWLNRIGVISDQRIEQEKRRRGSADYQAASGVMRDILVKVINESYEKELAGVRSQVSLIWGADDTEVPVAVAHAAHDLIADSTLEVLPGVGHLLPVRAPDALRRVIADSLR